MEEHRLTEMPEVYDQKLFLEIYKNTEKLKNRLVSEISLDRFPGMEAKDVKSWFNTKLLFTFQKYYEQFKDEPEVLKAHIINSLSLFKCRVLRKAYTFQNESQLNSIPLDTYFEQDTLEDEPTITQEDMEVILHEFKRELSPFDYNVLLVQLYPPEYILHRIKPQQLNRIPIELIASYFDVDPTKVKHARTNIKMAISQVRVGVSELF